MGSEQVEQTVSHPEPELELCSDQVDPELQKDSRRFISLKHQSFIHDAARKNKTNHRVATICANMISLTFRKDKKSPS